MQVFCFEEGMDYFFFWGGKFVLNQERKDFRMLRILFIFSSFLSWFKDNTPILASFLFSLRRSCQSFHPSFPGSKTIHPSFHPPFYSSRRFCQSFHPSFPGSRQFNPVNPNILIILSSFFS